MEEELKRVARLNLMAERKNRNLVNNRRNYYLKKDAGLSFENMYIQEAIKERDFHHSMMHQAHNMAVSAMNNL
jgi:hypothetical protein